MLFINEAADIFFFFAENRSHLSAYFLRRASQKKDELGQRFFKKSDFIFLKSDAPYETTFSLLRNLVKFFF